MSAIYRMVTSLGRKIVFDENKRNFSISAINRIKQFVETEKDDVLTIEGKILPDPNKHLLVKKKENNACPICSIGLEIKHTDVLIISQFVRSNGTMLPQRLTGLCKVQQVRIGTMVTMAQKAGLMPNMIPSQKKREPSDRPKWKKFNTYYDEKTIKHRYWI